jgi:hypothetical protein
MSGLPLAIYKYLRPRAVRTKRISYKGLCSGLAKVGWKTHWRSPGLWKALGEVVIACHAKNLGALPALVVRRDLGRPGASYYPVAHMLAKTQSAKLNAWRTELALIATSPYPTVL